MIPSIPPIPPVPPAVEAIGWVAAFLTTFALLPQAFRVWRIRSARDVSLGMYVLLCAGIALWLVYGVCLANRPIIVANAVALTLSAMVLALKIRYR